MRIEHDIFDLIGGGEKYHSAILSCYSFDPVFFSSFFLPNLRSAGMRNILVLVDASNYDAALEGFSGFGTLVREMKCNIVRMRPTSTGVFHSKIVLLFGKKDAFVAVGSGNLTYSGQVRNDELWGAFQVSGEDSHNLPILKQAWDYINLMAPKDGSVGCQLSWIHNNCLCLEQEEKRPYAILAEGYRACFVGNTPSGTIFKTVRRVLGDSRVNAIRILSPFYDGDRLTSVLQKEFSPGTIHLVYDDSSPMPPVNNSKNWKAYRWENGVRRLHAKAFQFECPDRTVFVLGSANATCAAWGTDDTYSNDEACIIMDSQEGRDFFADLGIDLSHDTEIKTSGRTGYPEQENDGPPVVCHILSCMAGNDSWATLCIDAAVRDVDVVFMDCNCELTASVTVSSDGGEFTVQMEDLSDSLIVELRKDGVAVSNRCLVLHSGILQSMNPNESNRKLDALLEASPDWHGHIEEILSYAGYSSLRWDEVKRIKVSGIGNRGKYTDIKRNSGTVSREDFEQVLVDMKLTPQSSANIRIADFLNANLKGSSVRVDDSDSSENISQQDIDSGLDTDGNSTGNQLQNRPTNIYDVLVRYCRKTALMYDKAIARVTFSTSGVPEPFRYVPTIEDYSILATLAICTFYCQVHPDEKTTMDWKNYAIATLSKFFVLFRNGPQENSGYSYRKSMEFLHDATIYFLLVLSSFEWFKLADDVTLLLLNILDTLPKDGIASRENVLRDYGDKVRKEELAYQEQSVNAVIGIFTLSAGIGSDIIGLEGNDGKFLVYRNAIGYCHITAGSRLVLSNGLAGGFAATLSHPAFGTLDVITGSRLKVHHLSIQSQ